jgi:hypothetical protein
MKIQLTYGKLVLPEDYVKLPLKGLNKWNTKLKSGKNRGSDRLASTDGSRCCLAVLSESQGRLVVSASGGRDGEVSTSLGYLCSKTNPLKDLLFSDGLLPQNQGLSKKILKELYII